MKARLYLTFFCSLFWGAWTHANNCSNIDKKLRYNIAIQESVIFQRSDGSLQEGKVIQYEASGKAGVYFIDPKSGEKKYKTVTPAHLLPTSFLGKSFTYYPAPPKAPHRVYLHDVSVKDGEARAIIQWDHSSVGHKEKTVPFSSIFRDNPRHPRDIFKDAPGLSVDKNNIGNQKRYTAPDGKELRFNIHHQSMQNYGATVIPSVSRKSLRPNRGYTFAIFRDGSISFGHARDSWELGVKHGMLADNRELVTAGEIMMDEGGNYRFNILSGTFSRHIQNKLPGGELALKRLTGEALEHHLGKPGTSTDKNLLSVADPDIKSIKQYCLNNSYFRSLNAASCAHILKF